MNDLRVTNTVSKPAAIVIAILSTVGVLVAVAAVWVGFLYLLPLFLPGAGRRWDTVTFGGASPSLSWLSSRHPLSWLVSIVGSEVLLTKCPGSA